ncbi:hypothetical protein DWF04_021060 [Cereibacter sphaeroides f. sp. denitrificans]
MRKSNGSPFGGSQNRFCQTFPLFAFPLDPVDIGDYPSAAEKSHQWQCKRARDAEQQQLVVAAPDRVEQRQRVVANALRAIGIEANVAQPGGAVGLGLVRERLGRAVNGQIGPVGGGVVILDQVLRQGFEPAVAARHADGAEDSDARLAHRQSPSV